ncbi:amidohydrolase family protein [Paracoccus benzoatiresistens]|uniref:Amidohydrolase family protein n=1 Tax=Paracoccus benzoatiresistens TaxID=2997341 RepID=A0ABT4J9K3_9RHOB|nr:amidohydrolase family protein [Paracoccus sp. EF6]MCZ0963380.1 amidohydrolase family protein [Paracoccus sp. EF6]
MQISPDFPVIDAHQHFWDPQANYHPWLSDEPMIPFRYGDYGPIRKRYLPPDYLAEAAPINVVGSVYVETEWDPDDPLGETRYAHGLHDSYGYPNAVVAQAWLDRGDAADLIARQASFPLVRSVRHKPASAASPAEARRGRAGGMDDPVWRAGFAQLGRHGLMFDLQAPWWELDAAADLAADFPATTIVLNHAGLPADRSPQGLEGWRRAMARLARHPNVVLKISGIGLKDRLWSIADNGPVIRDAISIFGWQRCMFASNFPVDSLVGSFPTIFNGFYQATSGLPDATRRALFCDNAVRIYRPALRTTSLISNMGGAIR